MNVTTPNRGGEQQRESAETVAAILRAMESAHDEIAALLARLLPPGASVLDAGCGDPGMSLAILRRGDLRLSLLPARPDLRHAAEESFRRAGVDVPSHWIEDPGLRCFDLVITSGILDQQAPDQQADHLARMMQASRKYILAVTPNPLCFWQWLWRSSGAGLPPLPWGRETDAANLFPLCEEMGAQFLGARGFGGELTRELLPHVAPAGFDRGMVDAAPPGQRAFLAGWLASVAPLPDAPPGWQPDLLPARPAAHRGSLMREAVFEEEEERERLTRVVDGLTGQIHGLTRQINDLSGQIQEIYQASHRYSAALERSLELARGQRAWSVMLAIRKAYTLLTRPGLSAKAQALTAPADLLAGRRADLARYELEFPDIWNYLPAPAQAPRNQETNLEHGTRRRLDFLIFPVFEFEFRFQRPQQIAAQLARMGHRVFWISPSRVLDPTRSTPYEAVALRPGIWEVRVAGRRPELYTGSLSAGDEEEWTRSLQAFLAEQAMGAHALLLQFPFWRRIAARLRREFDGRLMYDCMDDWKNWKAEPRISAFNLAEEEVLAREADVLIATSAPLAQRLQEGSGRPVLQVRNAADFEFFNAPPSGDPLGPVTGPVAGYYGAIADWVDVELMTQAAEARPQYTFVVIGEVHGVDVKRLASLNNVRMLGEKHYRLLPAYLQRFDACLLPFKMDELTRAVDPVKVYEYLSQGKAVVATPLPELERCGELLYRASTRQEFLTQLDRAVEERDENLRAARISFARRESWTARAEQMLEAIAQTYPLVSILVLSYRSGEFLKPCLDSILRNTSYPRYEVIALDNGSGDGSAETIRRIAEESDGIVRAVPLETNLGFAGGNNEAARQARGDYLVLLNADTMVTAGWLERLLRPLRQDPSVGLTAPVTNYSGNQTRVQTSYRDVEGMEEFARQLAVSRRGESMEVPMAPLLCAAFSRKLWEQVGELDEQFGIGMFEDDDFSLRIRQAGYRVVTAEDCFVHHFGHGSFESLPAEENLRIFEANRQRFEAKWNRPWKEHELRPGVRKLRTADRIPVSSFLQERRPERREVEMPRIVRLRPAAAKAGTAPVLAVECAHATPGASIRLAGVPLVTTYGGPMLLTAPVPEGMLSKPGAYEVSIENDFGVSAPVLLRVEE